MEIKDEKKSFLISIIGIVGIVAIVGIVVMLTQKGGGGTAIGSEDIAGEATILSAAKATCKDSDNGAIYTTKGSVSGISNGISYVYIDKCLSTGTLLEYYCPSSTIIYSKIIYSKKEVNCQYGCKDGACLAKPKSPVEEIKIVLAGSASRQFKAGEPIYLLWTTERADNGGSKIYFNKYGYTTTSSGVYYTPDGKVTYISRGGSYTSGYALKKKDGTIIASESNIDDNDIIGTWPMKPITINEKGTYTLEIEIYCPLNVEPVSSYDSFNCAAKYGKGGRVVKSTQEIYVY